MEKQWYGVMVWLVPLLTLALAAPPQAGGFDQELPRLPKGYSWIPILGEKAALVRPEGWYVKEERKGTTQAFFVTREDIAKKGSYRTGLSLNVVRRVAETAGVAPSVFARQMLERIASRSDVSRQDGWEEEQGPFVVRAARFLMSGKDHDRIIAHYFLLANDRTGTLFVYVFESPTEEWDAAWRHGAVMMENLVVDDTL